MKPLYDVSKDAERDLLEIWRRIDGDSVLLANRIEGEFHETFASLSRMPRQGHTRKDLTRRPVLFLPLYSFLIVYQPNVKADPDYGRASRQTQCEADPAGAVLSHRLHIQIPHIQRIFLNKLPPAFHILTHETSENLIRLH